jgi:hypothetical protein
MMAEMSQHKKRKQDEKYAIVLEPWYRFFLVARNSAFNILLGKEKRQSFPLFCEGTHN